MKAQPRTLPAGDVFRAKLILALADGRTWARIYRGHSAYFREDDRRLESAL